MGQIISSSDVLAGACLSAMCMRVLSSCSMGSTLVAVRVHFLFVVGRLFSSCHLQTLF